MSGVCGLVPKWADLVLAEGFLSGDVCLDPVLADEIVKVVFQSGERKYPHLWPMAERYVKGYELASVGRIVSLSERVSHSDFSH